MYIQNSVRLNRLVLATFILGSLLFASLVLADIISGSSTTANSVNITFTQLSLAKPVDAQEGDLLVAIIAENSGISATTTPPTGWNVINRTDNGTNVGLVSYWRVVEASDPDTYSWTISPQTRAVGGITRYRGVDITNPIDAVAGVSSLSAVAVAPSVSTTVPNDQIVTAYAYGAGALNTGHFSTPGGMTEKYDTSFTPFGPSLASDDTPQATVGDSGTKSANISPATQRFWVAQTIALKSVQTIVIENFDSYATSASLNGQNGGTGWSTSWAKAPSSENDYTVETAPAGGVGNAAKFVADGGGHAIYDRTFSSPQSVGTVSIRVYVSSSTLSGPPDGVQSFSLRENGTQKMQISFDNNGHLKRVYNADNSGIEDLGPYSANTWYDFSINFDTVNHPNQYRVSIDGGNTYSAWQPVYNGETFSAIDEIDLESWFTNSGETAWWDDIRVTN